MSDQNIAAVRKFWKGFNDHNLDIWDEVCTADFINHDPGLPTPDADLTTVKHSIRAMQTAFPDMSATEQDLIVDGDKVVVRRALRGTHQGDFMGIPPTGKPIDVSGVWLAHLTGGKIKEQWVYFDAMGMLRQIGAMP